MTRSRVSVRKSCANNWIIGTVKAGKTNGADAGMASLLSGVKARNLQRHAEDFSDSNVKTIHHAKRHCRGAADCRRGR